MRKSKYKKKDLKEYLNQGLSHSEIAIKYNTTTQAISTKIYRLSLSIKKTSKILIGKKFSKLTVLKKGKKNKYGAYYWICICDCGNKKEIRGTNLTNGLTKSCGCIIEANIKGKRFGRLKVKVKTSKKYSGSFLWKCICDCGNEILVTSPRLKNGNVKSCGCLRKTKNIITGKEYKVPEDLLGKKFGYLEVLSIHKKVKKIQKGKYNFYVYYVKCLCHHCNKICIKNAHRIATGGTEICITNLSNKISDEELIIKLRKFLQKYPNRPSSSEFNNFLGKGSSQLLEIRFGSWEKALKKVGYEGDTALKYIFDERYFKKVNHANKAYFLGLIATDGSIHKDRNTLTIGLQDRDSHILELLLTNVKTNKPLQFVNKKKNNPNHHNMAILELTSPKLKKDLSNLGINPQKTFDLKFPNNKIIPDKYMSHYIRGVFDGDGSISKTGVIDFTSGSGQYLQVMKQYLENKIKVTGIFRERINSNAKKLTFNTGKGKLITKIFYKYLYSNEKNCFLKRKKISFEKILSSKNNKY